MCIGLVIRASGSGLVAAGKFCCTKLRNMNTRFSVHSWVYKTRDEIGEVSVS